jgi:glycosyltransferase involved in cell wall biosynthesis
MSCLWFFSRDERTHRLFRTSWHRAAQECGIGVNVVSRGFGFKNALKAVRSFVNARKQRHVIFGTSEICLYSLFSHRQDIWVFTGLGRLLLDEGWAARAIRAFLRRMHRGQQIVVLNPEDQLVIQQTIGAPADLINGEGYAFRGISSVRPTNEMRARITFAYVGRLLKSKGVDRLVADFARHSNPSWTLKVIGDSDFANPDSVPAEDLQRLAQSSNGRIIYTGFQQDVRAALESVDVLVSLSRREGLPFSVLDGIESGAHLVLSPVPGHLSFSGLSGVTFVEPAELGRFFEQIRSDPHKFLNFDRAARQSFCARKFGQDTIVESIKHLFKQQG